LELWPEAVAKSPLLEFPVFSHSIFCRYLSQWCNGAQSWGLPVEPELEQYYALFFIYNLLPLHGSSKWMTLFSCLYRSIYRYCLQVQSPRACAIGLCNHRLAITGTVCKYWYWLRLDVRWVVWEQIQAHVAMMSLVSHQLPLGLSSRVFLSFSSF